MDGLAAKILIGSLFIIMMGMGLSLTIEDFKRVLKFPLAVFVGFLNQIILLPIIAYVLIIVLKVDTTIAMGLMIMSACPGGPTSNLVTFLAKGDVALSVTLTAINSLVTIVTIPLIVNFAISEFIHSSNEIAAPVVEIAGSLFVIIAIPLVIGMVIKSKKPELAHKLDKPVRIFSTLILVLIILGICAKEKENIVGFFMNSWEIVLAMNVSTMLVGFIIAKLAKLDFKQSLCICIESGNQNGTLAIAIVSILSANILSVTPEYAIPAAVYSLLMYVTALVPIYIGNRRNVAKN
ncbi:MAG: bile acid:sodium symporter family protein [Cytophagales bacterium]|nr:bile acid:sodium symporter family protein [Cytophagales bacterium]